ncbi:MAG: hypothetical protein IJ774_13320 [Selenomonadaceae bacterium]|nr:hypothetical protein [Selenomonadaceae bacterium]
MTSASFREKFLRDYIRATVELQTIRLDGRNFGDGCRQFGDGRKRNRPSWMTAAASRMIQDVSCDAETVDRSDNISATRR